MNPQFNAPRNIPSSMPNQQGGAPNMSNYVPGGQEFIPQQPQIVIKSRAIRNVTQAIIKTRAQLKKYLQNSGLDLYTSAVEFKQTGDFILSSYVVYPKHDNQKEALKDFLKRYPDLSQACLYIRDNLSSVPRQDL